MKKLPERPVLSAWPALLILAAFIAAGVGQCLYPTKGQTTEDACGGKGSHPVTIGGMVIGCR